ncbi:MAG: hypothetical protein H6977_10835 [Gammaproteobacteria bacterium]|nr:hypothetical protein [Gammaproteobacteria bacterium]
MPRAGRFAAACRRGAALLAGVLVATACPARPVAPWASPEGLPELMQLRLEHLVRSRCVPQAKEVAWPVYPGAVLAGVAWGRVKPACVARDGWADLGGVTLLSRASPAEVAAWYAAQLDGYERYEGRRGVLFMDTAIDDFLWDRDYYKYPNIALTVPPPDWAAAGYRTRIEFNRPAP